MKRDNYECSHCGAKIDENCLTLFGQAISDPNKRLNKILTEWPAGFYHERRPECAGNND